MERRIEYRQLISILSLFLIVQLLGLLIAFFAVSPSVIAQASQTSSTGMPSLFYLIFYIMYFIGLSVFIFFIIRHKSGRLFLMAAELLTLLVALYFLLWITLASIFPGKATSYPVVLASLLIPIFLIYEKRKIPSLRNGIAMAASVGVGLFLGIFFNFLLAYFFMAFLALYDYIAVFVTKHMQSMAKTAVEENLALLIGTSDTEIMPNRYYSKKDLQALREQLKNVKIRSSKVRELIKSGNMPVMLQSALGAGDLAMPLMLAVSAYITFQSYFIGYVIAVSAAFGLVFTMYMLKTYKIALPAIPPLFAFIGIGLGIVLLIAQPLNYLGYLSFFASSLLILYIMIFTAKRQMKAQGMRVFK